MALRSLMLRKKIDEVKANLERANAKKAELETREAELEAAIDEAETEEEKAAVEEEVEKFEAEKAENATEVANFEEELNKLETELSEEEQRSNEAVQTTAENNNEKREENKIIMSRREFFGMNREERSAFLANEEVKAFLERARTMGKENRAVTGGQLLIPSVVLNVIREHITEYSKLIKHVNLQAVPGKARQTVQGTIPEAVWTEMCGKLNELSLVFNSVEVDGYKVGGFIPVCNALLEDSDENLAAAIIEALGAGIGYALDKAIVYGTGSKMPLGIFTRLAQTQDPSDDRTNIPWSDLHTSHVVSIAKATAGVDLFKAIIGKTSVVKDGYAQKDMFWVMNKSTYTKLLAEAVSINAAGAIVSGQTGTMPIIGGAIETRNFVPDDVIIGGYGELYLLAERQGGEFAQSEHVRFTDDQTVFKGTARYDGVPVIAESFIAIGINGTTPSASGISFATDAAN